MKRTWLLVLILACAGPGDGDPGAAVAAPTWTVETVARIGSLDDPEQSLTRVTQVIFGPAGEIVIPQPQDDAIRVYGPDGAFLSTIGRSGEGPGEFGSIRSAGFMGDTLWVSDGALSRLTFFDLSGQLLRTTGWARNSEPFDGGAFMYGVPSVLLPDRTGLVEVGIIVRATAPGGPPPRVPPVPFLRMDSIAGHLDTLAWRELRRAETSRVSAGGRDFLIFWTVDDTPIYEITADGSGMVVVERFRAPDTNPSSFVVHRIDVAGDTAFSRSFPYNPIPMPATAASDVADLLVERLDRGEGLLTADVVERELRSAGLVPATLEPVADVATGLDGTSWLKLAAVPGEPAVWLVLDGNGDAVGSVALPSAHEVLAVTSDRLATLELDEFDVPYVNVYRLNR